MQISFKQVQYFLAAAETGQFSAAASKTHVTQTTITSAIRELETTLGVQLFVRHHASGVSLSADGQTFLHHAYAILGAVNSALHDPGLRYQHVVGKLRVASTHSVLGAYIVPAIAQFTRTYPRIQLELLELSREALEQQLRQNSIDLGLLWLANLEQPEAFTMAPLTRSRRQLWLAAAHPLLHKRQLTLADIASLPYALYDMDDTPQNTLRFWQAAGLEPNICYRSTSIEAIRSLVAQNMAITILSDVTYRPFSLEGLRIEQRPLENALSSIEIGLAWPATQVLSDAAEAFKVYMQLSFGGPSVGVAVR